VNLRYLLTPRWPVKFGSFIQVNRCEWRRCAIWWRAFAGSQTRRCARAVVYRHL